jgi:hypothetical protein
MGHTRGRGCRRLFNAAAHVTVAVLGPDLRARQSLAGAGNDTDVSKKDWLRAVDLGIGGCVRGKMNRKNGDFERPVVT